MNRSETRAAGSTAAVITATRPVEGMIHLIRSQRVMLDSDLAVLYEVTTSALNQAVRRNRDRFPEDFMFQLTNAEMENLKSQIVISSWGGRRSTPFAFTEHGVAMLASVLRSPRAIQTGLAIVRAFIRMRQMLATHADLVARLERLEGNQERTTAVLEALIADIDQLAAEIESVRALPVGADYEIGFVPAVP